MDQVTQGAGGGEGAQASAQPSKGWTPPAPLTSPPPLQVLAGGMAQSTRVMVVVGNGMGGAGFGVGKHLEAFMATKLALANAQVIGHGRGGEERRGGSDGECMLTV